MSADDIVERLEERHQCTAGFTRDIYRTEDRDLDLEASAAIRGLRSRYDSAIRALQDIAALGRTKGCEIAKHRLAELGETWGETK